MKKYLLTTLMLMGLVENAFSDAVREDAQRYFDRGMMAVEMAKAPSDYQIAVDEFKKALAISPGWADVYYNLGMVEEKAHHYNEAMGYLRKYLQLSPGAADAAAVKSMINKIEFRQERVALEQKLTGVWIGSDATKYQLSVNGNDIELKSNSHKLRGDIDEYYGPGVGEMKVHTTATETILFHLQRQGSALSGTWESTETKVKQCIVPKQGGTVEGVIDEQVGKITLQIQRPKYKVFYASPFPLSFETHDKCEEVSVIENRNLKMIFEGPMKKGGIGADVMEMYAPGALFPDNKWSGRIMVMSLKPAPEAIAAGVKYGDEIVSINGKKVSEMEAGEAYMKLGGEPGQEIELGIIHSGADAPVTVRVHLIEIPIETPEN